MAHWAVAPCLHAHVQRYSAFSYLTTHQTFPPAGSRHRIAKGFLILSDKVMHWALKTPHGAVTQGTLRLRRASGALHARSQHTYNAI